MTNIKKGIYGVTMAMSLLVMTVFSQFGIQKLVEGTIGWKPPKWVCHIILTLGAAGAIVALVASCGVSMPMWVAIACKACTSVAA